MVAPAEPVPNAKPAANTAAAATTHDIVLLILSPIAKCLSDRASAYHLAAGSPIRSLTPGDVVTKGRLVLRFRSSHHFAAPSRANFGIKGALASICL